MDDEALIARIAVGDEAAMAEFYTRWFPQFARLATKLTGDAHAGEDVAQDAAVRAIMKASSYKPGRPARAWLLAIVYNRAHDWGRRAEVRRATSLSGAADDDSGPRATDIADREPTGEEKAVARERAAAVNAALAKLSDADRAVILLRDYAGVGAPDAARELGITVEKVGSRLFRARKRLGGLLHADWPGMFPSHEM